MGRFVATLVFSSLVIVPRADAAFQAANNLQQRFERLAAVTTHFATDDIITNRWLERRWPTNLLDEQKALLEQLESVSGEQTELRRILHSTDAKVRTLALAALFIREDKSDLPFMADMLDDRAATFTRLQDQLGWTPLARMLEIINPTLPSPLVETRTIYKSMPSSQRSDQSEVLARWRTLLRQHFMERR